MNPTDPIIDAIHGGAKDEALRLIAEHGVWTPFRDPGYFDTEVCFPVFSSLELIPSFLRSVSFPEESAKAQQMGPEFFSFAAHLDSILTLNPGTDSEWKFGHDDFAAIAMYARNG